MNENTELLRNISKELAEIKTWIRISALPAIRRAIDDNLRDDMSKLVYELSDGTQSSRDIATEVAKAGKKIAHATVVNMWRRWVVEGIVVPAARKGRYMKVTSLESLGIAVPDILIKMQKKRQKTEDVPGKRGEEKT